MEFWYLLGLTESGNLASRVHAEFILHMLIIDTEQWVSLHAGAVYLQYHSSIGVGRKEIHCLWDPK